MDKKEFTSTVLRALGDADVVVTPLGTFWSEAHGAVPARNPQTGAPILISGRSVLKYAPSSWLLGRLHERELRTGEVDVAGPSVAVLPGAGAATRADASDAFFDEAVEMLSVEKKLQLRGLGTLKARPASSGSVDVKITLHRDAKEIVNARHHQLRGGL